MADIVVPPLGESVSEASVAKWLKKPGDAIAKDELLVELETDKVGLSVAATETGVLSEILVAEGASVGIGAILGRTSSGAGNVAGKNAGNGAAANGMKAGPAAANAPMAAPAPAGSGVKVDVVIPQMGESVAEGTVARLLRQAGDAVNAGDELAEIETDKVAVMVPAPVAGLVAEWLVAPGAQVAVGTVIARIASGAASMSAAPSAAPAPAPTHMAAPMATPMGEKTAPPSVQRIAAENNLPLAAMSGSGKDGRLTKADALAALEKGSLVSAASVPAIPATLRPLLANEERVKMTRLRQTIARRLKEAQNQAAMLTTFNEADMSAIMAARNRYKEGFEKKHGVRLGFMSFFVKACVLALKEIPAVNAEIDGDSIIYKNHYDIGVAVGTERGLVVPVLRGADHKGFAEIEKEIGDLGLKARDGALSIEQLTGGTFTITNGGVYGSLMSTPILNPPQSGILGMHSIKERPVAVNGQVVIRPMMYLALSYDHRIVDGREAVTFLVRVKECLEDPERLLLDL